MVSIQLKALKHHGFPVHIFLPWWQCPVVPLVSVLILSPPLSCVWFVTWLCSPFLCLVCLFTPQCVKIYFAKFYHVFKVCKIWKSRLVCCISNYHILSHFPGLEFCLLLFGSDGGFWLILPVFYSGHGLWLGCQLTQNKTYIKQKVLGKYSPGFGHTNFANFEQSSMRH